MKIRCIIAGGRDFGNFEHKELLNTKLKFYFKGTNYDDIAIVVGGAKGADTLGEHWAIDNNVSFEIHRAKWKEQGLSAGYKRNVRMAMVATHLIAFWDGKSRGTKHMIDIARKQHLDVRVVRYDKNNTQWEA